MKRDSQNRSYTPEDGFPYYFDLAKDDDLYALFSAASSCTFLKGIGEEKGTHRYAPNKWSIKQIVGHITDHERIKMFRAFQLSRNEMIELWGYDQNLLVNNARFDELTLEQLITDFSSVRKASLSFIDTLSNRQLKIKGNLSLIKEQNRLQHTAILIVWIMVKLIYKIEVI